MLYSTSFVARFMARGRCVLLFERRSIQAPSLFALRIWMPKRGDDSRPVYIYPSGREERSSAKDFSLLILRMYSHFFRGEQ